MFNRLSVSSVRREGISKSNDLSALRCRVCDAIHLA